MQYCIILFVLEFDPRQPMLKSHGLIVSLILLAMIQQTHNQQAAFTILSSPILVSLDGNTTRSENISICFADCQSCTASTGVCESCFTPWFQRDQNGVCQFSTDPTYVQQSTIEQRRVNARVASLSWFRSEGIVPTHLCSLKNQTSTTQFNVTGMMGSNQNLTYRRIISNHDYIGLKFLLILTNWCQQCGLLVRITDEDNNILAIQNLTFSHPRVRNANNQSICSDTAVDKRLSISLTLNQRTTRYFFLEFRPSIPTGNLATYGVGTFALITGKCNNNCETCDGFSSDLSGCRNCKRFLANNASGQKCSTCLQGFALNLVNNTNSCRKCDIRFKTCNMLSETEQSPILCQQPQLTNISENCSLDNNNQYRDQILLGDPIFFSSLFRIIGSGSITTRCGQYSIVGPTQFGNFISRTFLQMPSHLQISINFNIYIVDQDQDFTAPYTIVIRIDGQIVQLDQDQQIINITGTSNQCGLYDKVEAMATFSTPRFIKHQNTKNVVIQVGLGTPSSNNYTGWGLRDVRIISRTCDQKCTNCTDQGCQNCLNNLIVRQLKCNSCLPGASIINGTNVCDQCPSNCLECSINSSVKVCTKCPTGFYFYEFNGTRTCQKNPNYFPPKTTPTTWTGGQISTTCKAIFFSSEAINDSQAVISRQRSFIVGENSLKNTFNTANDTFKKKISFYLLKIDDWNDLYLDIYANDLLIYHKQFNNTGSRICETQDQNDQLSFEEFTIQDLNDTTAMQFEVVDPTYWSLDAATKATRGPRTAKFGISDFAITKIGCAQCEQQNFDYRLKYSYDEELKIHMEFNRIYINKDPAMFKNIFELKVNDEVVSYDIVFNDSIRYILKANATKQVIQKNITVLAKYPLKVTTDLRQAANKEEFFNISSRVLQQSEQDVNTAQYSKPLNNQESDVKLQRWTPLGSRLSSISGIATFFEIISRITIYVGLASFFIGCQTPFTHMMHNLQKLWIHIYIAALAVSPLLKASLTGFREVQNQNIAVYPTRWESNLPQFLYYDTFARYQQQYYDLNFWRNIYNVGVAFLILSVVYIVMRILSSTVFKRSQNKFLRHLRFTFVYRPLWYFNSIIFYQYFTVVLACYLQFLDFRSRTSDLDGFNGITIAATIIAFIFVTLYPIIIHIYLARKRKNLVGDYGTKGIINLDKQTYINQHIIYQNKFGEIFFRFLPRYLWNYFEDKVEVITQRQLFYNLLRFGQLWWLGIIAITLANNPFGQAFLLMLTTAFHLMIVLFFRLNHTYTFKVLKSIQLLFFLGLQIIIIVLQRLNLTLRSQSYDTLGIVGIIFIFVIVFISIIRVLYTFKRIVWEYSNGKHILLNLTPNIRRIPNQDGEFEEIH